MIRVFTTGQVARVFSVNINTVIKWFDEGKLKGFRLPRSNERRIYRESVLEFMEAHEISTDLLRVFDEEEGNRRRSRASGRTSAKVEKRGAEQRTFPRKQVNLEARLESEDGPVIESVTVRNLSMGGVLLTGLGAELKSIPVEFRLTVQNEQGRSLDGTCQVVYMRRRDDATVALGCRFTQVDPGTLQAYLSSL